MRGVRSPQRIRPMGLSTRRDRRESERLDRATLNAFAARLGDRADGGQILLDATTAERTRDRFPIRSLGRVSLKNLSAPVEVWQA